MVRYKRNQVEEAVAVVMGKSDDAAAPDIRVRLKRLLDADRTLGRDVGSDDPERALFAFYSGEAPGSGTEVWFSEYEAFALHLALRLLGHGWPQGTVVGVMRQVRPKLEREHRRILSQDPQKLFDQDEVRRRARAGSIAVGSIDAVFLAIVTPARSEGGGAKERASPKTVGICRGQPDLMRFLSREAPAGMATTCVELTNSAHLLAHHLGQTQPKRRGRGG